MYVEITSNEGPPQFAIHDLNEMEMELLQSGLVEIKRHSLQDAETFRDERTACNEMFNKIDQELRNSRS